MQKTVTLVITGGIAAYKSLILIRRLKEAGVRVIPVMTRAAREFVTPLSVGALAEHTVYDHLFDLQHETDMAHIRLMRDCDFVLIAPASADFMAKMAHGLADDLPSTAVLASDKPIILATSMNAAMWAHPATQSNRQTLLKRGVEFWGPADGELACGDVGYGRMIEPEALAQLAIARLQPQTLPLASKRVLVTAGPTREALDPVRYISNHSSGKQGFAIAEAFQRAGADVTLISGPTSLDVPSGVTCVRIETAVEMLEASLSTLPADIAIMTAAVADWRADNIAENKMKKVSGQKNLTLRLTKNPDILASIGKAETRPDIVIGFAAETENLFHNARAKLRSKGADLILANDVGDGAATFGADTNQITMFNEVGDETWPTMSKHEVAEKLVQVCIDRLKDQSK